jgi:hypothetical protein
MLISWVSLFISFLTLAESDDPGAPISKFFFPYLIVGFALLVAWWMNLIKGARNLQQAEWVSIILWTVPARYVAAFSAIGRNKQIKWAGICSSVTRRECFHSCFMFHVSSAARLRLDSASGQVLLKTFKLKIII